MTRAWTRLLSNNNKNISSYMKLQLNNIVVTDDPVSLYSVTQ